jgi:LmbE family N-acetylglucosaminyl deacetylase
MPEWRITSVIFHTYLRQSNFCSTLVISVRHEDHTKEYTMKLDLLAIGAHPDDVELACAATIGKMCRQGKKIGILDLTQGELGTRGTKEIRLREALESAKILGLSFRHNCELPDGNIEINDRNTRIVM